MVVRINGEDVNLSTLSKHELMQLKYRMEDENDSIRDQLRRAEAHQKSTGEYADPNWYWSAVRAYKYRTRTVQAIQIELSKRKVADRSRVPDNFMDIARLRLAPELFQELLREAQEVAAWNNQVLTSAADSPLKEMSSESYR